MQTGFRGFRQKKRLMAEINVVPYIDVTLVLLIIFMITAPIVQQAVTVDLPDTPRVKGNESTAASEVKPFIITITRDGFYKTSEDPVPVGAKDLENLVAETMARAQMNPQTPIYLQGDKKAEYGKVVKLFAILKANGVDNVSLMTEPEAN